MKHLIFYDQPCPLCNRAVRFVLQADKKEEFYFAPLQGKTAEKELSALFQKNPRLDTLVLLQNYGKENEKTLIEGRAVLRILWLLDGRYKVLGWLSFLPSPFFDWIYRLIAKFRYHIFETVSHPIQPNSKRFLP